MKQKLISAIEFVINKGGTVIILIFLSALGIGLLYASYGIFTSDPPDDSPKELIVFLWFIRVLLGIGYTAAALHFALYLLKRKR